MSRRAAATWLVLAAVAALATAALWDAFRADSSPSAADESADTRLGGGTLPGEGVVDGTLVFVTLADCRPQTLRLGTLTFGPAGPPVDCGLWAPPEGDFAAVSLAPALGLRGHRLALLRLTDPPTVHDELGIARGEPSWSDDGQAIAWCAEDGDTVLYTPGTGARERVAGCRPNITPDGSVLTRSAAPLGSTLYEGGEALLRPRELLRAFPADSDGPLDVVGYDRREDGLLAVVVVRFETGRRPRRLLELWRGGRLVEAILLPELTLPAGTGRLGDRVEFGPTGNEIAVAYPGAGKQMVVVDLRRGEVVVEPRNQHGFAWSPDGRWLAISTGEEIRLHGPRRGDAVYVLPVGAAAIAWR
jgi:WD40-like Beta Propeller Repeat